MPIRNANWYNLHSTRRYPLDDNATGTDDAGIRLADDILVDCHLRFPKIAGQYAYIGRKQKKRNFRSLWILRINAAARENNLSYGKLISGLKAAKIELDRKILSEIAVLDPDAFTKIVERCFLEEKRSLINEVVG